MTRRRQPARAGRLGRPRVPIQQDPQRFEIAAWWAFHGDGCGPFDAARRALLAVKSGPITVDDIEGVLHRASATIPLPPFDPDDPDKGLRRLAAKARGARPEPWLICSARLLLDLMRFIRTDNMLGIAVAYDWLIRLGWGPTIAGLVQRVEAALGSNLPPADLTALGTAARKLMKRAGVRFPKHPKKVRRPI
jgi:hypothetical protein